MSCDAPGSTSPPLPPSPPAPHRTAAPTDGPFPEGRVFGVLWYMALQMGFFHLVTRMEVSCMFSCGFAVPFFSLLSSVSLSGCTAAGLFIRCSLE